MAETSSRRHGGTARRRWFGPVAVAGLLASGFALAAPSPASAALAVVVNSTGDAPDAVPGDGTCETATAGECTLRAAIEETNAVPGADTISFAVPGSGVRRISPLTPLPFLSGVTIDGYTQPGSSPNTLARGSNAVLKIELYGGAVPGVSDAFGLVVTTPDTVIRGLVINGYGNGGSSIYALNAPGLIVEGNFIGTDASGTTAIPNTYGMRLEENAVLGGTYRVGGTAPARRNVISGNAIGVTGWRQGTTGLVVEGNLIGTNAAGTGAIGNNIGVLTLGAFSNAFVGGTAPGAGNVISGNQIGVNVRESVAHVLGNLIGTDVTGLAPLGNVVGINVVNEYGFFPSTFALPPAAIGDGTVAGRNVIAASATDAVQVQSLKADVRGNYIGVGADGTTPMGNGGGVLIGIPGWALTGPSTVGGNGPGDGNVIAHSRVYGVVVNGTWTGNRIIGNRIFDTGGMGIDLTPSLSALGATLNHVGTVAGPNNFQNFPVVSLAVANPASVRVAGTLEGVAGQNIQIDVYRSTSCNASTFGEGETHLGSFPVTFTANGKLEFDQTVPAPSAVEGFITTTATDLSPTGGTSEFSYCVPSSTPNVNWVSAQPVVTGAVPGAGPVVSQKITTPLQEKWFKFPVQPGAKVRVQFNGQPGSSVSLHRDPNPIYNGLTNPSNAAALSAEAADTGFLPSGWLPSGWLPSGWLPSGWLPSGWLDSGSLPSGWLPSGWLPSGWLPSGWLPSGWLPTSSLPSGWLPSGWLPSGWLPTGSLPSGSLPSDSLPSGWLPSGWLPSASLPSGELPAGNTDAYATAARKSLIAVSADPYSSVQTIERNSYDLSEDLYVRVVGPASLSTSFSLEVSVSGGACAAVQPVNAGLATITGTQPSATGRMSVVVTDSTRLAGTPAEKATALGRLQTLSARPDVAGAVVDLGDGSYPRVAAANAQADANPGCPSAKNTVAAEIKRVVDTYRAVDPSTLQYVVLAGGADVIPFHQVQDVAGLANETEEVPPVAPNTPSEAGLKSGLVKGQDFYGSADSLSIAGRTLALPGLAVGRLVDGAADVSAAVDSYIATDGVVRPGSSLVTGYDFVGDAAEAVRGELAVGTQAVPDTLIQAPGEAPSAPSAWTADQLRTKLLAGGHDLVMLTGHFSAGNLLAADYKTTVTAAEVQASTTNLRNVLVLALGCHGGLSLPSSDLLAGASPDPDWAKAFLRKGAAGFVAATGYAYGDTELTEYGERLFVNLAQQLRTGGGPVALGQALVDAKRRYLADTAQITGIDEKTVVEMALYGLPMMKVDLPGNRITTAAPTSIVTGTSPVVVGPGAGFGLTSIVTAVNPAVTTTTKVLPVVTSTGTSVTTSYGKGRDGVVANPFEPILPKQIDDVTVPGRVLRGVALRGGTYSDVAGITPLTSAPATETTRPHSSFNTEVFYPNQTWMPNYLDAVDGGRTRLVTVPSQFRSTAPGATDGTLRTFDHLDLALYYLPDTWTDAGSATTKAAAVSPAVGITGASATADATTITFKVNASNDGSAGVQAVWVLYTGVPGSPFHGRWAPLDLTQDPADPATWTATLPLSGRAADVRFMVQAVNGAGLTSLATNLGAFYGVGPVTPPPPPTATTVQLVGAPTSAPYLTDTTFTALLTGGSTPLPGRSIVFDVGSQRAVALTGADGRASVTLAPAVNPGTYAVQANFRGDAQYTGSTTSAPFRVDRVATSLTITPASTTVASGASSRIVATLRNAAGQTVGDKPVTFVLTSGTRTVVRSVNADLWGDATLGDPTVPPGVYTVRAYFSGSIPLAGGDILELTDPIYLASSSTTVALTVTGGDTTAPVVTGVVAPPNAAGWYNAPVSVHWSVDDPTATQPPDSVITAEGVASSVTSVPSCDLVGNCATGTVTVKLDLTGPTGSVTTSVAGNEFDWNNVPVTVSVGCADALSGVATCPAPVVLATEGVYAPVSFSPVDVAGNVTSVSSRPVNIDLTRPVVTLTAPANGATVAQAAYVRPTCTASDALSGLDGVCSVNIGDPVTVVGGYTETVTATASDKAGNTFTTAPVTYRVVTDAAGPVIDPTATPLPNGAGWWKSPVTYHFVCTDPSGVASCPPDRTLSTQGANQSFTVSAADVFGTASQLTVSAVNIDLTAPTVTVVAPTSVAPLDTVTITCAATDALSGIATATCADRTFAASTLTPGANVFTFSATDVAGNTMTVSKTVTLVVSVNPAPEVRADMGVTGLNEIGFQTNIVVLTGTFSDPNGPGPYTASVRWTAGGSFTPLILANGGSFVAANVYASAGVRTVTVRICDAGGACGTDDVTVRSGVTQRITPVRQCVTNRGASVSPRYAARWGYDNPAPFAIAVPSIPILENTFTTAPFLAGQPQILLPGSQRNVFTTTFNSGTQTWRINGNTASATTTSPAC